MIGAIVLTMHKGVNVKRQEIFLQNTREYGKTVVKTERTSAFLASPLAKES